jgi:hypothetical protein
MVKPSTWERQRRVCLQVILTRKRPKGAVELLDVRRQANARSAASSGRSSMQYAARGTAWAQKRESWQGIQPGHQMVGRAPPGLNGSLINRDQSGSIISKRELSSMRDLVAAPE